MKFKVCVASTREDPPTTDKYIYGYIPGCYNSLYKVLAKCDKIQRGFDAMKIPWRCDYERVS